MNNELLSIILACMYVVSNLAAEHEKSGTSVCILFPVCSLLRDVIPPFAFEHYLYPFLGSVPSSSFSARAMSGGSVVCNKRPICASMSSGACHGESINMGCYRSNPCTLFLELFSSALVSSLLSG